MLYYYERTKTMRGPFKINAENDKEALDRAKKECEQALDTLLCVYDEDFRMVWEQG